MGRPEGGYKLDGERIPGVTTISGLLKPAGPLMHWAWELGLKGQDYKSVRDEAAAAGTVMHSLIEQDWHGKTFDRASVAPDILAKADHAFEAYKKWAAQTQLRVTHPEVSLVSRTHRFGGTIDGALVGGDVALLDFKSSNGIYQDMLVQVAGGYALLWEEHFSVPLTGLHLLRFSKPKAADDPITFSHHFWGPEIFPIAKEQFLLLRRAYDVDKRLRGLT